MHSLSKKSFIPFSLTRGGWKNSPTWHIEFFPRYKFSSIKALADKSAGTLADLHVIHNIHNQRSCPVLIAVALDQRSLIML